MRLAFAAALLLASAGLAAAAPTEDDQRAACTGDVFRLCLFHVPDRERITRCMVENHGQLSQTCRYVFDASMAAKRRIK